MIVATGNMTELLDQVSSTTTRATKATKIILRHFASDMVVLVALTMSATYSTKSLQTSESVHRQKMWTCQEKTHNRAQGQAHTSAHYQIKHCQRNGKSSTQGLGTPLLDFPDNRQSRLKHDFRTTRQFLTKK